MKSLKSKLYIYHIFLGVLLWQSSTISTYYGIIIILLGSYFILSKPDPLEQYPLIFASYLVGIEVLLRMTGSTLFWEFGKYGVIYFLFIGILRRKSKINLYLPILFYLILLLPAIILVPLNSLNLWRQDVSFNLSGPVALTFCTIYFYNRTLNKYLLGNILYAIILPIISMATYNILVMPDLSAYNFLPYSDVITSGGYGPNQVSSIFGLGIACIIIGQVLKLNLSGSKLVDLLFLIFFFGLGLITFSRGGILATILSFSISISIYLFRGQRKIFMFSKGALLLILVVASWFAVVSITDGVIMQRYGFGNSTYGERFVLDLTGRGIIYEIDLEIFKDNIFVGVGPGQASGLRELYGYSKKVAAHTEYSRMLSEHGVLGLFSLFMLVIIFFMNISKLNIENRFIKIFFGLLALLTMGHSAMRLVMPAFIFGFLLFRLEE